MTLFERGSRYINEIREIPGPKHHPLIQFWFTLCSWSADTPDEVPWCSVGLNGWAWDLRLPRSKSAAARSWLDVGAATRLDEAKAENDVVVLKRGNSPTKGHVGVYAGRAPNGDVLVLGANQSGTVSVRPFPVTDVLSVRRLV